MVQLVATQRMPFGKKHYAPGEIIPDASAKHAALLVKIGKARHLTAEDRRAPVSPADLPAAVFAAPQSQPEPEPEETIVEQEAAVEPQPDPRTDTRDVTTAGRTGQAKPSRSSRPARQQKGRR